MKKRSKILLIFAGSLVFIYSLLFINQEKFLFFPEVIPEDFQFDLSGNDEELTLLTSDGERVSALYFSRPENKKVALFFHGNGGSLNSWQELSKTFLAFRMNVLMIDYRGYGKSSGHFSEQGFYADGEAAFQFLISQKKYSENQIILFGRSIGTGVASELAVRHQGVRALILETPYTKLTALAQENAPLFLPWLLLRYRFDNLSRLQKIKMPLLIIHGTKDETIPSTYGKALFQSYEHHKQMLLIAGGGHNNLGEFPEYSEGVINFLNTLPQ